LKFSHQTFFDGIRSGWQGIALDPGQFDHADNHYHLTTLLVANLDELLSAIEADDLWNKFVFVAHPDVCPIGIRKARIQQIAYLLATIRRECGPSFESQREIGQGRGHLYGSPVLVGPNNQHVVQCGYGYSQVTWLVNWCDAAILTGVNFIRHPEQMLVPANAYRILITGWRTGSFTGHKIDEFINATTCDFYNARQVHNGTDHADEIKGYAEEFERILTASAL
jgi:hypothetical protein